MVERIEPNILFASDRVLIGAGDAATQVNVSELVEKDSPLLGFEASLDGDNQDAKRRGVVSGEYTYFSQDKNTLYAEIPGYPRIDNNLDDYGEAVLVVSVEPLLRISPDKMKVSLAVHPPLSGYNAVHDKNLVQLLTKNGVVFGLIDEKVKQAAIYLNQRLNEFTTFPIAMGSECGESRDGYLEFALEIGPIAGKVLDNGTIDFRERRIMVPVSEGDLLANLVPARHGSSGTNVFGEEVKARAGEEVTVKTIGEVHYSPETGEVRATGDGTLSVVRGDVIRVSGTQKIPGNIDFNVGNVQSKNCVVVNGSILPGFQLQADGDIEVGGTVNSATVICGANLVAKGGITGDKSRLQATGDVDIIFIEKGRIKAGGNCVVRKQVYYSRVHAQQNIRCRRESVVVGSELVAAGSVTLGGIGTESAEPSLVAAGVVPERMDLYRDFRRRLSELQGSILAQMQKGDTRSRLFRQMKREEKELKLRLAHLNFIPGAGTYSKTRKGKIDMFSAEESSAEGAIDIEAIGIEVYGTIQAGTEIYIGNRQLVLDRTISSRYFKLSSDQRRIHAVPLSRLRN